MSRHCLFENVISNCPKSEDLIEISETRMLSVKNASKKRKDLLCKDIPFPSNKSAHKNCLSTYTSSTHIDRYLKRNKNRLEELSAKKARRSSEECFIWKKHCLFCGDECDIINTDTKHPNRWRKSYQCRTSERGVRKAEL